MDFLATILNILIVVSAGFWTTLWFIKPKTLDEVRLLRTQMVMWTIRLALLVTAKILLGI